MESTSNTRPQFVAGCEPLGGLLDEAWSVDRLAQVLGISSRTVHRRFLRRYGLPPMSVIRRARLENARQRLRRCDTCTTVTEVALDCGFNHLGRFSQAYALEFGESPSETLRRARRREMPND